MARADAGRAMRRNRLGGTEGNELLTGTTAAVLTGLLLAEGLTILQLRGLLGAHMFIGLALIPPLALKLASTGYRFVRYYAGSRLYRDKGPPHILLRALAPVLVVTTIGIFVTGVVLLGTGHKAGAILEAHKVFFILWAVVFAVHFLAYAPRVARSVAAGLRHAERVPGTGLRWMLVAAATGGGMALAIALLPTIDAWQP